MAVDAENTCFENMGFDPYAMFGAMPSVFGIQNQNTENLDPFLRYDDFALPSSSSSSSSSFPMDIVQSLSCDFEKQRVEMDWFIQLESRRLRRAILAQESHLQAVITHQYELRMRPLMLQKDEEISTARIRTRNLQDLLKAAEMEARMWEKAAREKEAVLCDLKNRLNAAAKQSLNDDDDTASFCDSSSRNGGERSRDMVCKLCEFGRACVVLLPCRHLCCCKLCDPLLDQCPVCHVYKDQSLEAFLG